MADTGNDASADARRAVPPSTPRWVKVSAIVALLLVVLIVVLLLVGGGEHSPGRHVSGDGGEAPASTVTEGHTPPAGGH